MNSGAMTIFGFAVGFVLAVIGMYCNPFTTDAGEADDLNARALHYSSPFTAGLTMTHNGQSRLPLRPTTIPELWENAIKNAMLSVVVLRDDGNQPVGIASRVSQLSERTDMLSRGVLVDDDWLVTIMGEGSFFIRANNNLWPFLKETLIPVWYLDWPWYGPKNYRPTVGPSAEGFALVTGGTGAFDGVRGTAIEDYKIDDFDKAKGPGTVDVRLFLQLPSDTLNPAL